MYFMQKLQAELEGLNDTLLQVEGNERLINQGMGRLKLAQFTTLAQG